MNYVKSSPDSRIQEILEELTRMDYGVLNDLLHNPWKIARRVIKILRELPRPEQERLCLRFTEEGNKTNFCLFSCADGFDQVLGFLQRWMENPEMGDEEICEMERIFEPDDWLD